MACLSSEGWWDYLSAKMDRVADSGVDGLYYDNIFSTCFCPRCQDAYADFSEARTGRRLTFQQLQTFDRGSYMSGGIEVIAKQEVPTDLALLEEQFRLRQIVSTLARIRERFQQRTGKSLLVCNAHNRPMLNDVTDIILTEDGVEAGILRAMDFPSFQQRNQGFPGLGDQLPEDQDYRALTNAGLYKYMAADGGYDKLFTNFQHPLRYRTDPERPMTPTSWQRSIAEAHAFGGDYLLVSTHLFLPALDNPAILDAVAQMQRFLAHRRDLWDAIYPVSDTLVAAWNIGVQERALGQLALESVPFEVMPVLQVDATVLARFKSLMFLEEAALRQVDKPTLAQFAARGGRVLLLGLDDGLLGAMPREGVVCLPDMSAEALVRDPSVAARLKRTLTSFNGEPPWAVDGERGVVCNLAKNAAGDRLVFYVVNLRDEPVRELTFTVRCCSLPAPTVTAYSPDGSGRPRRLRADVGADGTLRFALPQVILYTTITIDSGRQP